MLGYQENKTFTKIGTFHDWNAAGNPPTADRYVNLSTAESKGFLSHSNPYRNGHYVSGGNFLSVKRRYVHTPSAHVTVWRPGYGIAYKGAFTAGFADYANPNTTATGNANAMTNLSQWGATAWNRMRPDQPDFTLATSLGELKDLPQALKDAVKGIRKKMGKAGKKSGKSGISKTAQYTLALQFGWLPLLKDIQNFVRAQSTMQARLDQLIRDNGRPVKRSVQLAADYQTVELVQIDTEPDGWGGSLSPVLVTQCYKRFHSTYRNNRRTYSKKVWAEGVFRYHLPPGPQTVAWKKKMLRRIMGSRVTPDTIYNLMPWSWLVDYFTDLGQFIEAVSPGVADRLAADYAYVMQTDLWTTNREGLVVVQAAKKEDSSYKEVTASATLYDVRKMRHKASPFGWGIKQTDLKPTQLAILGTLGLSKLP